MAMFLLVALLLCTVPAVITCNSGPSKALKFTETGYIVFTPDMSPFVNKMSVCMWLRDFGSPGCCPTVFNYGPSNQVRIDSHARQIEMAEQGHNFQADLARVVTKGEWYHACLSWSSSSQYAWYYVNGELLGSVATGSRTLSTGNKMVIGHHSSYISPFQNSNSFVGEVSELNVYAKELTAEEVKRMFSGGLCGLWEEENEDVWVLTWEDILKLPRTGSVGEVSLTEHCSSAQDSMSRFKECESRLNETSGQLKESLETLTNVKTQLNTTLSDKESLAQKLAGALTDLKTMLAEKESLTEALAETQAELNSTAAKLAETQAELNTTLADKESLNETLAETQAELSTTAERLAETQADLNTSLAENESLTESLAEKQTQINTTMENLQEALEEIQRLNRTWDWDMFSLDEYLNKTVSREMAEQMKSSWDGISG